MELPPYKKLDCKECGATEGEKHKNDCSMNVFLKLKDHLQNEGDRIELKLIEGEVKDGNYGPQLTMLVELDGKEKKLSCDAPHEENEMRGSQLYRGIMDNNVQEGDEFTIAHGGNMKNQYRTTIYTVMTNAMPEAPGKPSDGDQGEAEVDIDSIPF